MGHNFSSFKTETRKTPTFVSGSLTQLPSVQETKDLATHPMRPQRMFGQKENDNKNSKESQSKCSVDIFLTKNVQVIPKNFFQDSEIDITKRDILRHIQRDIFNPSIRYPKYLKRSLADYKERIGNYTKYLEIKI